ncbi:MAG: multidrug effflux MFS transporter [Rhizobiales bacterium]|nr:multidrug effflux MFS transporter [Hyphomicrobiales bacterium]
MTIQNAAKDTPMRVGQPVSSLSPQVFVLAALASVGTFATSILLPSLPSMAKSLNVSTAAVASTISVYLAVFAVGQIAIGPISDRFGRWKPVVFGLVVFVAGSMWCEFSNDLPSMLIGRCIQALGACSASVLSRAIARDLLSGEQLTRAFAFITVAMAAAPGFSPLIGGLLDASFGWRTEFLAVGFFGLTVIAAFLRYVGETHKFDVKTSMQPLAIAKVYWNLATDIRFLAPAGTIALSMGALFAMFSVTPRVLIDGLGYTPLQLGFFFAGTVFVVFGSGIFAPRFAKMIGHSQATIVALSIALFGGAILLGGHFLAHTIWSYLLPVMVFLSGFGMITPLATATTLQPFGDRAGSASALLGFMQMGGASAGVAVTASIASATLAIGLVVASFAAFALALYLTGTRAIRAA